MNLEQMIKWHFENDVLFRRLVFEAVAETDPAQRFINEGLVELAATGKIEITESYNGELMFALAQPN